MAGWSGSVGLVIVVLMQVLGGGGGTSTAPARGGRLLRHRPGQSADNFQLAAECRHGSDANAHDECAIVADINSIEDFWRQELGSRYNRDHTVFFSGSTQTGCGSGRQRRRARSTARPTSSSTST